MAHSRWLGVYTVKGIIKGDKGRWGHRAITWRVWHAVFWSLEFFLIHSHYPKIIIKI
jgi:hypothetical protein